MELLPDLEIGWLNGWIVLVLLGLTEGTLFLVFPESMVARLFDRSNWSPKQRAFTIVGKLCRLICLVLIIFTPLKFGQLIFIIGATLIAIGLTGSAKALFDYKNTPLDEPVTHGFYRVSRHPQITMASVVLMGACIAIGSWLALGILLAARLLGHFGVLAEEQVCMEQYGEAYHAYLKRVPRYFVFF